MNASPIKAPKRTGLPSQLSGAGGAVSNWAPLSRLKNSFSNTAMSVNTATSGNGVSGSKNKLGTPFIPSSRQDFSVNNSELTSNKENNGLNAQGDTIKSDSPDHASLMQSSTTGTANQNNSKVASSLNDTIVSNELEVAITESTLNNESKVKEDDEDDPNSTMQFESGRPLEEELWFHGVLPRGKLSKECFVSYVLLNVFHLLSFC